MSWGAFRAVYDNGLDRDDSALAIGVLFAPERDVVGSLYLGLYLDGLSLGDFALCAELQLRTRSLAFDCLAFCHIPALEDRSRPVGVARGAGVQEGVTLLDALSEVFLQLGALVELVGRYRVDVQTRLVFLDNDVDGEVLGRDRDLVGGNGDGGNHVRGAAVGDVDDRGVLAEVVVCCADLLGRELDADRLQRLDLLGLAGLGILPLEGDVDSLDLVGGDFAFGDGVDLIDNRCCSNRSHNEFDALR